MLLVASWAFVLLASCWTLAGVFAVRRATRRSVPLSAVTRGISVLKPLRGNEPHLEENLETFFRQDQAAFELVFGVIEPDDPAADVVRRVSARHPEVKCQLVVHPGGRALNPKIKNLMGLLPRAEYDLVLISDSNVQAPRRYLSELSAIFEREQPGLVTNLFAGGKENSLGGALESVELAGFCASGVALPTLLGDPLLVGKSALFSRQRFLELGGFERFADVLAEDFVIGKTFAHAGERVILAPAILVNVTSGMSLGATLARHLRWAMLRFRLRPVPAALEPLTSPLALLPLAWLALGPWALAWALALGWLRDVGGWLLLRGATRLWIPLLLSPFRDLLALFVWSIAPLKQHVSWRGQRFRLGAGTLLYPERVGDRVTARSSANHGCLPFRTLEHRMRRHSRFRHQPVSVEERAD